MKNRYSTYLLALAITAAGCGGDKKANHNDADTVTNKGNQQVKLPAPYETESTTKFAKVLGWPKDKMPTVPEGFEVSLFADSLRNPRNIYVAPNGDILYQKPIRNQKGRKRKLKTW
ncbi:hypothetical protein [Mucilaginibacter defluvii]|uniref:Glucose/sorbosone dehydrogenase n=1 Tax=Mucilaginibacter defluvii TaxID=1196019 RepID=A0ABP9G6F7_9SPHI